MPETVDEIEGCTIIDLSPRPIPRPSAIPERGKKIYYTILLIIEGMFNGAIVDLAEKPYIPKNFLLQLQMSLGCNRHSYF